MIILDERKALLNELKKRDFQLFDFFENVQQLSHNAFCELSLKRRNEVLLVDAQSILANVGDEESFLSVLNTFLGVIFFKDPNNKEFSQWLETKSGLFNNVIGVYPLPLSGLDANMLSNQLQFFWTLTQEQKALQKHMAQFSSELDTILQTAQIEMSRAKKIHDVLIPKRSDEIKGIRFFSKYAAGEGGGGDFYDLEYKGNKIYQVFFTSQSYLISSTLMGILNKSKQSDFDPIVFIQESAREINLINSSKKKKSEVDLVVVEIDVNQLTMKPRGWGHLEVFSQNAPIKLGLSEFQGASIEGDTFQLQKGEFLGFFSPGFMHNWKQTHSKESLMKFIQEHATLPKSELLMELFFEIKKKSDGDLVSRDSTVVMMEVNRHGIHQV